MDPIPCLGCSIFFIPRNKLQTHCSTPACQRARKALWQRQKLATDPEYAQGQKLSNSKWLANNPDYWKDYRSRNPEKAARNRVLQQIRNRAKAVTVKDLDTPRHVCIAKMDARKPLINGLLGEFWLVPMIAKMDAVKIFIAAIPDDPA
ncbi:MAG: hypothetical protein U5K27_02955 [Desulfotignum sp.]|nr:hypothetical protein [Desulfotignum sp.]